MSCNEHFRESSKEKEDKKLFFRPACSLPSQGGLDAWLKQYETLLEEVMRGEGEGEGEGEGGLQVGGHLGES